MNAKAVTGTDLKRSNSAELFNEALDLMPGGVNSPVRAFKSIGTSPVFIKKAKGAYLYDEDDNKYIDYVGSWGPMILGHANEEIEFALIEAIKNGTSFGAPTAIENEMAREVIKLVPSIEMVRMVNSGTEAVMGAIRLARAYTKRSKIVKFTGCYHGHADALLVQAGSGAMTLGLPDSPGVTANATKDTILIPYNDEAAVKEAFAKNKDEIAAIILEPVIGNAGCIAPKEGYLEFLRAITKEHESLLIFDEVMTGFRVSLGGAQEYYAVMPDLTTLGKVIGGGLPVGAYGGRRDIMELVAPAGPMYQAGTLSGNPLAMTAGLTCLRQIQQRDFYKELDTKAKYLVEGLREVNRELIDNLDESSCSLSGRETIELREAQFTQIGAMFGMAFNSQPIHNYEDAKNTNTELFRKYYMAMLDEGVYLAPSAFEAGFVSAAHSYDDLDATIEAHRKALQSLINS